MSTDCTDLYLRIAKVKIADLIRDERFKTILAITANGVWLEIGDQIAKVDPFGQVSWELAIK